MLENVYQSYRILADSINWKQFDKNDLFFNYLKYKESDPLLAEKFYAAIMCRYWGYTGIMYTKCNKNVPFEECYDVLIDTINYLLEKHVWDNPDSSLYNDPKAPEKAFHFVIKRQLVILLAKKTADKRKAEFKALSIDDIHDKYSDAAEGLFNLATSEENLDLYEYICNKNTLFEKVILDMICFSSWRSLNNVATKIKNLNESNFNYYYETYFCSEEDYKNLLETLSGMSTKVILSEIKKCLYLIRNDWI